MLISRFANSVDLNNGYHAVFNSLIMKPLFLDSEEYKIFEEGTFSDLLSIELKKIGVLIDSSIWDETALTELKRQVNQHCGDWDIMYLITTSSCNLACKYCFLDNNPNAKKNTKMMGFEVAKTAVDKFSNFGKRTDWKDTNLLFYGGEPTLNFDVIKKTIEYCNENSYWFNYSIITNATTLTADQLQFLTDNGVQIGVSIDGPKNITDKNRVFKNSNYSVYDKAIDAIKLMKSTKSKYSISCTIAPEVVDNKELFQDWIDNLGVHNIYFNIYHYADKSEEWMEYYPKMSSFMFDEYYRLLQKNIIEGKCCEIVSNFVKRHFKNNNCGAVGRNQVAIAPDGDIFICQGDVRTKELSIGNILVDDPNILLKNPPNENEQWSTSYTANNGECLDCEALSICGGGCPLQSEALFGDRCKVDKASCVFYKYAIKYILQRIFEKSIDQ